MCRDDYDDLEKQRLRDELLHARALEYEPLIEQERQPGSFSHAYARGHCGVPAECTEQVVDKVCDAVKNAIFHRSGPLSKANFRSYMTASLRREAVRWRARQMRFVSLDAPNAPQVEAAKSPDASQLGVLSDEELRVLYEFLKVFIRTLLPADRPYGASSARPLKPELREVLNEFLSLQTNPDVRKPQELSMNRAVATVAPLFNLNTAGRDSLNRAAYRWFDKSRDHALASVPAASPIVERLFGDKMTPTRLNNLFHCIWQRESELAEQGGPIPFIYTARSG